MTRVVSLCLLLLTTATSGAARAEVEAANANANATATTTTATPNDAPLVLVDVLGSIERTHPSIAASRRDGDAARAEVQASAGGFDTAFRTRAAGAPAGYYRNFRVDAVIEQPTPVWGSTVFGGYRIGRGDVPVYDGKLLTNELGEARAGIVVPALRNGSIDRRRANIERADIGQRGADAGIGAAILDTKRTGALRYWEWVAAGTRTKIADALLEVALRRDEQIAKRVERGDLPPIERQENARSILQRQSQKVAQDRAFQQASIELSQFFRSASGVPIVPGAAKVPVLDAPTSWPLETFDAAIAAAYSGRPDLERLALQKAQAKVEVELAKNQRLPALDFQVVVSKDFGDGLSSRRPVELEAQVFLDVPIQNRVARGRAVAAEAALAKIAEQERGARDRIGADVRDATSAIDMARARLAVARSEVAVSQDLERAEWARFAAGDTTLLVVNLREQATFDARVREVDAMAECQRALVLYRAATARLR